MIKYISEKDDLMNKYFKSKEELDAIRSDMTLLKWEILSKAYKLGKKIWGPEFSVQKLAKDMDLPYTTVKRCLALDKASEKSWERLKNGEISAFKLAMICLLKNRTFQDEIVTAVIEDNIPTHKIKAFKARSIKDVNKWRHERAVEKGYARKDSAHIALKGWISRGERMLLLPLSALPEAKHKETIKNLKRLRRILDAYIKKHDG